MTVTLLIVLVAAKAMALAGHHVPLSVWTPVAWLWQDAAIVLVFAVLETSTARAADTAERNRSAIAITGRVAVRFLYITLVLYVAANVPVTRVLSTPLTWRMWRAAGGPLADSIRRYVTWSNVALIAAIIGVAGFAPRRLRTVPRVPLLAVLAAIVALGPAAARRVDTHGLDRNAWTALAATALPRLAARGDVLFAEPARRGDRAGLASLPDDGLDRLRASAARRNIVLIGLESTAAQYLGLYGASPDIAPNLSHLARNAIVFDAAYAVYPESIKGLFSILCSAYPAYDTDADSYANAPCSSLAAVLASRGYRTALFHSGRFGYLGMDAIVRNRGYNLLADAGDMSGARYSSFGVDEPSTVARILAWIDALPRGGPFFITYLPIAGHHPYDTSARGPFSEDDEFGRYRNAVHEGDASLGTLVRGLRARGLDRTTVWIVFGDHGEAFGQHDGNHGHTFQLFEENIHVPLVIAASGVTAGQERSRRVASLIDVAPTILDLIGAPAPRDYEGRSLLTNDPRMAFFFTDYALGLLGLRDGHFKFISEVESGRSTLFDVAADPLERTDVSSIYSERVETYGRMVRLVVGR